jgi:hypothetical protein
MVISNQTQQYAYSSPIDAGGSVAPAVPGPWVVVVGRAPNSTPAMTISVPETFTVFRFLFGFFELALSSNVRVGPSTAIES